MDVAQLVRLPNGDRVVMGIKYDLYPSKYCELLLTFTCIIYYFIDSDDLLKSFWRRLGIGYAKKTKVLVLASSP